ncbi:AMP-binding protein [Noviherbaspirillum galbum]|uniref:AMP-binding protein n=1 Tax=Noviherbaspirillum galbum TaxID=2709383 RepID=A0A6B3SYE5_9BURK|nr:AMP-binding protein [Noviherbaspirillum galbum]NEX63712.1 AMP-binding protein [Noviherbaspirillum galbum]
MPVQQGVSYWIPAAEELAQVRDMTVGDLLDDAARKWPDQDGLAYVAYADRGLALRWSFAELRSRSREVARALIASGIGHGDRVAVWSTNLPEWLLLEFGAAYCGAVLVPINPLLRAGEVAYILKTAGVCACFALPESRGSSLWTMLDEAARDVPSLRLRVAIGQSPDDKGIDWNDWLAGAGSVSEEALEQRRAGVTPSDTVQVQFTSGTTGFPKGAVLSHRGVVNDGLLFAQRAALEEGSRWVNPMPLFHCGGCVIATLGALACGTTQYPMVTFEPDRVARTIAAERINVLSAVPTMLIALEEAADREGLDLSSIARVISGGSTVPVELLRHWNARYGTRCSITYGLTEASPIITQSAPYDPDDLQMGSCGQPLPAVEVDLVDAAGNRVPPGQVGEVRTRGWLVMKGYFGNAQATQDVLSDDGWLRTGDLGHMDERGYLWISGRAKDMIIRGGENISPREIEEALLALDEVTDANVIGVPDARYGEEVCAYVRLRPGAAMSAGQMQERLRERIARYKIPKYLRVVEQFPLTPSGKVQKFRLRELFAAEAAQAAPEPVPAGK